MTMFAIRIREAAVNSDSKSKASLVETMNVHCQRLVTPLETPL